ncbi:MAG: Gfo/Idh/MocA family oxidoreductase [Anaerolineae bacterium]|nr:Gfo/Idh/MocA family oxidoreductase [Anaerolineae bacterium]
MRVGVVGAGSMGNVHAPAWKNLAYKGAELVGIHAARESSAHELATRHGVKNFPSYEALLAEVDIVDLCVPTDLHRAMTVQAAESGKHIICEKPIALTVEDGRAMIGACEKANVRLFIAQVLRFVPQYSSAQAVVASGQIGKPAVIRLTRAAYQPRKAVDNWFTDEKRSGGMILDLMIHDYDYARWLAGNVTRVFAKSVRAMRPDAPGDYALVTLRFASGAIAHIEGGWAYPPGFFRTSIDIAGTGGLLEWSSDTSEPMQTHLAAPPQEQAAEVGLPPSLETETPFDFEIRHFYDALVNDKPFSVSPDDALAGLQIGLAARQSLQTGRAVTINQEAI